MAILHGSWIIKNQNSCLFLWGETWRSLQGYAESSHTGEILSHPLGISPQELNDHWQSSNIKITDFLPKSTTSVSKTQKTKTTTNLDHNFPSESQIIALPSIFPETSLTNIHPLHSGNLGDELKSHTYLQPWKIEGFSLTPPAAIKFLTSLPLNSSAEKNAFMGGDLRFWVQIARWSLDLISRSKFLPTIQKNSNNSLVAKWQVLLDSAIDGTRLEKFAAQIPLSCCSYQQDQKLAIDLPTQPQELILDFLNNIIDVQVREMLGFQSPLESRVMISLPSAVQQWLQNLTGATNTINSDIIGIERLEAALKAWTLPLQHQLTTKNLFRTCLELRSPENGETDWILAYFLQATDNSEFLIDAKTIWANPVEKLFHQNRIIEQPQETFLRGLGLASRLYPIIAPSLETESPQLCRINPMQAYEFIKSVAWRLEDNGLGVILPPSLANREGWANRLGLKITAETPKQGRLGLQSLLNFQWQLAIGGQTISKREFDRLVALNSPLVEINGEWVELRPQDIKTANNFFVSRKDQMTLSLEDALRISKGDTQVIEKLPVVSFDASGALQELVGALTNNQTIEPLTTPKSFQGQLRPYQERGAAWLAFLERWGLGACLADDMGLGKTVELIAFLLHLQEDNLLEKPTLLVCPTSVLGNWKREVNKFAPTLKVLEYHGDKRPKGKEFAEIIKKHDLVITSYSLIYRDIKLLQTTPWQMVVLDEAQNVKNSDSKQSQAVRQLETTFRIALTGTPVENRLQELWSILDFLNPGYLGNKQFFQRRFAMPIEKYGDSASLNQLRSLVQPFILRRLKTDKEIIQDLPEKQEMTVFCGLSAEQGTLYQRLVDESLVEIESAEGLQRRGMILALLVKLKQICNHPAQYLKIGSLAEHHSAKLQRLEEMLEEVLAEGDRALIFTQFAEWGKLLKPHLEKQFSREILFLYGSTTKKQREEMIDRFQNDPQAPPIMILSLKAGGVGLNLTRANHVFHFDRWWNPAVENQATDRVFRIGQTRNVQVHKFVCTGTLEEKINVMIESKKQLAEQVVGAGEEWLTEMDTDQLRNLLILDRNAIIDEDEV
ncbi:DEAD/DEAH box helicase [Cronbergia sp. UHCC 0137]|uniref:DEAD/DEAH box helicase n=1 Tax=Cronbergia sp. UHCC 0137 TaxID=3110239 RepID=UPI002B1EFDE2|nr:DEAD/DEAH box helicase [Cronbergia sp. UHCC 0137]MEA5619253.1 DEAD/DEAH box helicase [Cronbergia sp. UHCC 0137]